MELNCTDFFRYTNFSPLKAQSDDSYARLGYGHSVTEGRPFLSHFENQKGNHIIRNRGCCYTILWQLKVIRANRQMIKDCITERLVNFLVNFNIRLKKSAPRRRHWQDAEFGLSLTGASMLRAVSEGGRKNWIVKVPLTNIYLSTSADSKHCPALYLYMTPFLCHSAYCTAFLFSLFSCLQARPSVFWTQPLNYPHPLFFHRILVAYTNDL